MGKTKKHFNKKNYHKKPLNSTTIKKRKSTKDFQVVNKKAIFNRYKDKQRIEEEIIKKNTLEHKLQQQQQHKTYSDSEDDAYGQLVSCFNNNSNKTKPDDTDDSEEFESDDDSDLNIGVENEKISQLNQVNQDMVEKEERSGLSEPEEPENENPNDDAESNLECLDPFNRHLQFDLAEELLVSLTNTQPNAETIIKAWPVLGNLSISIPKPLELGKHKTKAKLSILEDKSHAQQGTVPQRISDVDFNELSIKSQIQGNIVSANKNNLVKRDLEITDVFTNLQKELFSVINNYQDLYFPERTFTNADEIRYTYCLHVTNHIIKTRRQILRNNSKLNKDNIVDNDEYRDQGLLRPKVLIIVPFKDAAYKVVKTIISILVPKESGQVVNKNRFESEFTGGELIMPKKNPKPEDYELLFSGNSEDNFKLGLTVTKKTLKLYADFYSSDILIASPLGLRMIIGAEGEEDRDYDFLSSIEILVMDQTDVFLMQNWDHLLHVFDHMHLQPKKTHGTDFSRIRSWAVNGWTKYYRQTLVFSSVDLPEIRSILNKKCHNYAGKVFVVNPIDIGNIQQVILQVPQAFHRFNATSPLSSIEERFQYFLKEILPKHRDPLMGHTLVYAPSYFDYVRIRNYFKKEDISFVQICEYSKDAKIARARDMFFHSEAHFLLYSERVHFFRRFRLKGIRHIIFYQPPVYPQFYSELCNLMQECNQNKYGGSEFNMSVTVLHCRYDAQRSAALLGGARLSAALHAPAGAARVHTYVTGG